MAYCTNCGAKLSEGAKFCHVCGAPVTPPKAAEDASERKQEYAGKLIKCPNCGELIDAFVTNCPSCGYEIRGASNSAAMQEFSRMLARTRSDKEKSTVIRSFPIPNTKEDILEFLILASTNINENQNFDDEVSDAWVAKIQQAYQKAELSFKDQPEFERVQYTYDKVMETLDREAKAKEADNAKGEFYETLTSGLVPILPNIIIISVWLISLIVLIPFSMMDQGTGVTSTYLGVLFLDYLLGAILIPFAFRSTSVLPQVLTAVGMFLNIIAVLLKYVENSANNRDSAFGSVLFLVIVFVIVLYVRILIYNAKNYNSSVSRKGSAFISVAVVVACSILCLIAYAIADWRSSVSEKNILKRNMIEEEQSLDRYQWPEEGLSQYLPEPPSVYGKIWDDTESYFSIDLLKVEQEQFDDYMQACIDRGFTLESTRLDSYYDAYNDEEYYLSLYYFESDSEMDIHLKAPMTMAEIKWPDNDLTSQIPTPDSLIGHIDTEKSDTFTVYLSDFDQDKYTEYIDQCMQMGFEIDYSRGETKFTAYNQKGYYLTVEHKPFDKIYINIKAPDD